MRFFFLSVYVVYTKSAIFYNKCYDFKTAIIFLMSCNTQTFASFTDLLI